jgi:hypothetical protein
MAVVLILDFIMALAAQLFNQESEWLKPFSFETLSHRHE